MTINWYGQSCFKITTSGGIVIATDPFDKSIGLNPPRFKVDIATISHNHYDHNNKKALGRDTFIIDTPGEYEIKGVVIGGIESFHDNNEGKDRGLNTIFTFETEGLRLCHLGDFGQDKLTSEQIENIGSVNILFIPVGGTYTIDGSQAADIVNQIEPNIAIPMHFKIPGLKIKLESAERFLKEMGADSKHKSVDKFSVKKKDLSEDGTEVVLMKV